MFGIIVALLTFMTGTMMVGFVEDEVTTSQADNYTYGANIVRPGLYCGNVTNPNLTVTDGTKLTCLVEEAVNPYFIVLILSAAFGFIVTNLTKDTSRR